MEGKDGVKRRREIQRECDAQKELIDKRDMELAEVRDRLKKREDEVRDLKLNLNGQLS